MYPGYLWVAAMIIKAEHDSKVAGHFGQDKHLEFITEKFHWPKLREEIKSYIGCCPVCQPNKASRCHGYSPLEQVERAWSLWSSISITKKEMIPSAVSDASVASVQASSYRR